MRLAHHHGGFRRNIRSDVRSAADKELSGSDGDAASPSSSADVDRWRTGPTYRKGSECKCQPRRRSRARTGWAVASRVAGVRRAWRAPTPHGVS